ncbi:MAG TPA: HAMP domain-containing sensor histidine kinase [Burkholderiaceae bacterium]|jgi:signal transduction histidine kinase
MLLLRVALGFSLFETLLLAGVLLAWADKVAGGRLLAAFLAALAVWITGNELPNWFGPEVEPVALHLLATAPLTSALFFHFCVVFCRVPLSRRWIQAAYAMAGGAALVSQVLLPAHFVDHPIVGRLGWAEPAAWITSVSWMVLGIAGVAVLLRSLAKARPPARAQIAAVTASCLWGVMCLSGYGIALLGWPIYPVPLLALPLYPLVLVYGILRYGVFVANAWAGRALVWTLLLAIGAAIVGLMPLALPFESRWLCGLAVAASCLALNGPVKRFVQRLVYPGGDVSAQDLGAWRYALGESDSLATLAAKASELLSQRLGMRVEVRIGEEAIDSKVPSLTMRREVEGWALVWQDWESAPPGQRHVAELFGTVLADATVRVEQAQQLAARERERQLQARLAELGALAASVAHDIRNPLNIISMAVAMAPQETRSEVGVQIGRIAHLASDLLEYAKPWKVQAEAIDLRALADRLAAREPGLQLTPNWPITLTAELDPRRLEQALVNLIENARGAAPDGCTLDVDQSDGLLRLHVCDNGPGVPADLRDRLFEPFASRSKGGTGLGLAIVARIAQAHGGRALLTERAPWRTCFTLEFPQ